jgi:hypothetical protein
MIVENPWTMRKNHKFTNEINPGVSLHTGEVASSILAAPTKKSMISKWVAQASRHLTTSKSRTERENDTATRGKSVDFDRASFSFAQVRR